MEEKIYGKQAFAQFDLALIALLEELIFLEAVLDNLLIITKNLEQEGILANSLLVELKFIRKRSKQLKRIIKINKEEIKEYLKRG